MKESDSVTSGLICPYEHTVCYRYDLGNQHYDKYCTTHLIRTAIVNQLLLEAIKEVCDYALNNETAFMEQVCSASSERQTKAAKAIQHRKQRSEKRADELSRLIRKLYEEIILTEEERIALAEQERRRAKKAEYNRRYMEKKRLAAYAGQHPNECRQTNTDPETGCMEFEIAKGRFSFRLTAPYNKERREAASNAAKVQSSNLIHNVHKGMLYFF